jgi:hypothetical protein
VLSTGCKEFHVQPPFFPVEVPRDEKRDCGRGNNHVYSCGKQLRRATFFTIFKNGLGNF